MDDPGSSVGIATGYGLDSRRGQEILLYFTAARPAVFHPASYIMGTGGCFLGGGGYGWRDLKLITHLHQVSRSRMVELQFHSSVCHYDIVLN
jgi:hypothetical protein